VFLNFAEKNSQLFLYRITGLILLGVYFGKKIFESNKMNNLRTLYLILKIKILGLTYKRIDEIVLRESRTPSGKAAERSNGLVFFKKNIIQKYKIDLKNNKNISILIKYFQEKKGKKFILTYLFQRQMSNHSKSD